MAIDFQGYVMIRLIIAGAALLSIVACASSGPETAEPVAQNTAVTGSAVMPANASDSPIDVVDIPADEQPAAASESERLICHRVQHIGTHRTTKVCRTRGQIDAERKAAQETLRQNQMGTAPSVGGE